MMHLHVLGSAAGGGFPQWNCNCPNCHGLREGTIKATARTQSSIAISTNNIDWVLFNTSPDILAQLSNFAPFQPARKIRDTAIKAIIFMDSQIDHTTGLLMLREGCPHEVYCTDMVFEDLTTGFPLINMLKHWNGGIHRHSIPIDGRKFTIESTPHLEFTAVPVAGKAPPYSPHRHNSHIGDNIGINVHDLSTNKNVFYAPGLASVSESTLNIMAQADCVLVDGTFWQEDEMTTFGLSKSKAADMGHLPQSGGTNGESGMIDILRPLTKPRKILIHINNTNPILNENSEQRKILEDEGIEVAYDGMNITI